MIALTKPYGIEEFEPRHLPADLRMVLRLQDLIDQDFKKVHDPEVYSARLCCTLKRLNRLSRFYLKKSVYEMIRERNHMEALRLLRYSDLSVKEITYELGICDPSWFCRGFKEREGVTPLVFRKEFREGSN